MSASDRQLAGSELIAKSYLNINLEGELLREAHDIIEELRIMMRIFTHQLSVTDLFSEHLAALHDKRCKPAPDEALDVLKDIKALLQRQSEGGETVSVATSNCHAIKDEVQRINEIINENATTLSSSTAHLNAISPQESKVLKPPPDIPETTISLSERVRDHMMSRRGKLQELEEQTIIIAEQLKDLLSLKQQQASIIEAKCASKSAEETAIQGRSIMLFTIITIVFLLLSFMSSVFGMNASDFDDPHGDGNKMFLRDQFRLLFPIFFAVIAVLFSFAVSPRIRCIIYYGITASWATVLEYTGIRKFFFNCIKKHEYHEKYGSRYKDRNLSDIYRSQQKKVARIYSRRNRIALNEALDKAESLNRCRDASRCPGLSDVDTSGGSLHRSRGRLASLFFSIKRLTVTQGNGFGNDGDLDAMEKGEWNCLPSSKKAT